MNLEDHEARIRKLEQFMAVQSVVTTLYRQCIGMLAKGFEGAQNDVIILGTYLSEILPDGEKKRDLEIKLAGVREQMELFQEMLVKALASLKIDPPAPPPSPES